MTKPDKVPWNLSVPADIKRAMSIHCATTGQEISELTEELWREFLKSRSSVIREEPAEPAVDRPASAKPRSKRK